MSAQKPDPWLSASVAAARLQVSIDTVRVMFDNGVIRGARTAAGHRRIDPQSLQQLRFLSVSEAARALNLSAATIRLQFDDGVLAGHRTTAGYRRIDPAAIIAELARREEESHE